jgi:hypothetical protein
MASIGVMPMPPAMSRWRSASSCSGKWLRGTVMVTSSPSRTTSCMQAEPPRPLGSRSTATT